MQADDRDHKEILELDPNGCVIRLAVCVAEEGDHFGERADGHALREVGAGQPLPSVRLGFASVSREISAEPATPEPRASRSAFPGRR